MKDGKFITLAVESSCDETSVAIMADGREILSNIISSQIDIHKQYGGVVPEIASRHHLENINHVTNQALSEAGCSFSDVDMIVVVIARTSARIRIIMMWKCTDPSRKASSHICLIRQ